MAQSMNHRKPLWLAQLIIQVQKPNANNQMPISTILPCIHARSTKSNPRSSCSITAKPNPRQLKNQAMEASMGKFIESVTNFFSGGDQIPWCDRDIIAGCEQEVMEAEKGTSDELKKECIMRLSWALVHSRQPADVHRGIAMLESSLDNTTTTQQKREKLYLLAVGYYRSGDYSRSRELVEKCLEIVPDWRQAETLKKAIEDKIKKDGVIGIGIAATAVGLVAGGIAAALARRN